MAHLCILGGAVPSTCPKVCPVPLWILEEEQGPLPRASHKRQVSCLERLTVPWGPCSVCGPGRGKEIHLEAGLTWVSGGRGLRVLVRPVGRLPTAVFSPPQNSIPFEHHGK